MVKQMKCPECGTENIMSYPITVRDDEYAQIQANTWPDTYDGISDASVINEFGLWGVQLSIDQSAYSTHNFFKDRKKYEKAGHIDIDDIDDGVVNVWFKRANKPAVAMKCNECGCIWDDVLGIVEEGSS